MAFSIIDFLENKPTLCEHDVHFQIGRGVPQTLSLEIHQGLFSLIISMKRFWGCSK